MLTHRQRDLLLFIQRHLLAHNGIAPSFRECSAELGITISGVHRLMLALDERGFIERLPKRARAIRVLRPLPDAS